MSTDGLLDGGVSIVPGMSFNKYQFCTLAHFRRTSKDIWNIARLIARRHNHRDRRPPSAVLRFAARSGDNDIGQGEVFERPNFDQKFVGEFSKQWNGQRQENFLGLLDHLTIGQIQEARNVLYCEPVLV